MILPLVAATVLSGHAEVVATTAWVTAPDAGVARIGLLRLHAVVAASACTDGGWAELEAGRVRCSALGPTDAGAVAAFDPPLRWGSVRPGAATVRAAPHPDAGVRARVTPPYTFAFVDDPALRAQGWLRRPEGDGFVATSDVWLDRPSAFAGEPSPVLPLAFLVTSVGALPRFTRLQVISVGRREVITGAGAIPRSAVRLAFARPRPTAVPAGAKWVHVDLTEQVLTAYEGDAPVFATLISSGLDAPEHRTRVGLFRVWLKALHDRMHGERYFLEEVPRVLFFSGGQGFHGTFWHEAFGHPQSHGCVNLSIADAQWLFDWAPPQLPAGWHTVMPGPAGLDALWVQIERAGPPAASVPAVSATR